MTAVPFAPAPRPRLSNLFLPILAAISLLATACERQQSAPGALARADEKHAIAVLKAAPEHGFAPDAFPVDQIEAQIASGDAKQAAKARLQLEREIIAYATAQHGLRIPAKAMPKDWGMKREPYDAAAEYRKAVQAGGLQAWLDGQAPQNPLYVALQQAYVPYLKVAVAGWPTIPDGPALKVGATGPRVAALRARLAVEDAAMRDIAPETPADAALLAAVGRFQSAHGITPSGALDKATLAELNVPAAVRAVQIRANLERLRWLPRDEPPTRIDVNTAAQTMDYFVDGKLAVHMLSASGKPGDETPMLRSAIDNIVLNPPWNVPEGIAAEELIPKGAEYLAANNFVTTETGGLQQQPGPGSALGLVKFDFDNPYAVYLHDTPAKAAFDRDKRAVSHGCVRLEHAVELARMILGGEPGWSAARVDEVLASRETTTVKLTNKIPVRLMYLTAFPWEGRIAFRPDIYGWDPKLLELLDHPPAQTAEGTGKVRKKSA